MFNVLNTSARRRKRQSGQAMLETALVFTAALSMIIFVLDMGRLMLMQEFITERARVTARAAAVNNWTSDQVKNYFLYNSITVPQGATGGYMGMSASQLAYQTYGNSGDPDYRMSLTVSNVPLLMFVPGIAGSYTAPKVTVTTPAQSMGSTN